MATGWQDGDTIDLSDDDLISRIVDTPLNDLLDEIDWDQIDAAYIEGGQTDTEDTDDTAQLTIGKGSVAFANPWRDERGRFAEKGYMVSGVPVNRVYKIAHELGLDPKNVVIIRDPNEDGQGIVSRSYDDVDGERVVEWYGHTGVTRSPRQQKRRQGTRPKLRSTPPCTTRQQDLPADKFNRKYNELLDETFRPGDPSRTQRKGSYRSRRLSR